MEELNIEDLKQEATELGIEFSDRIGAKTLKERIDAFYDKESEGSVVEAVEEKEEVPATVVLGGSKVPAGIYDKSIEEIKELYKDNSALMHSIVMKKIDIEAKKTRVVKLTMVDKREASTATSAYLNNGSTALSVPLDEFVEMPNALIEMAETAKVVRGEQKAGINGPIYKYVKKYVVEYK